MDQQHEPGRSGPAPLRVLTVLAYYVPHWTGLTMYARSIAEGLAADGAQVTVLCSHHDRTLPAEEVVAGVRVVRLATPGRLSRTPIMPGFLGALARLVPAHDVVHLHSPMAEAGLVALACRRAGVPLVVTHQGDVVMPAGAFNRAIERAMEANLAATFGRAVRVVTHNESYRAASMVRLAGDRGLAIDPPITFPSPAPGAVAAFARRHGLEGRPVVAFAGRWVEEKGFDHLLRAAPAILARRPDTRFVFAGEVDVAYETFAARCAPLRQALGDALVEVGLLLDQADLAAFYGAADVFVLPSRSDCHAAVQVEALRCGTPLVASDIPGARSIVASTGAGLLVAPGDEAALADAVVSVLDDPGRFAEAIAGSGHLGDRGRAVASYHRLLREVVDEAHGGGAAPAAGVDAALDGSIAARFDHALRRRLRWVLDRLPAEPGARVLDAGSGLGVVALVAQAARPDLRWVALDADADRLAAAAHAGVTVPQVRGDLRRLPWADGTFDAVVASEVLEHLVDDVAGAAELGRVLRPGGRLLVTVPHAGYPWRWDPIGRAREHLRRAPLRTGRWTGIWTGHERLYRPADLAAVLAAAGLEVEEVDQQTHHVAPFSHLAFYGLGRVLVDRRGPAPAGRAEAPTGPLRPGGVVQRGLAAIDRRNDHLPAGTRGHVSVVAAARRPS